MQGGFLLFTAWGLLGFPLHCVQEKLKKREEKQEGVRKLQKMCQSGGYISLRKRGLISLRGVYLLATVWQRNEGNERNKENYDDGTYRANRAYRADRADRKGLVNSNGN